MASNKENSPLVKIDTKIPLPKNSAKAFPKHLLTKTSPDKKEHVRQPLKTLHQTNPNVPSSSSCHQKTKKVHKKCKHEHKIDTKYVTERVKNESLDWNYNVFNDLVVVQNVTVSSDDTVSISSDDTTQHNKECKYVDETKQRNLGESSSTVTPFLRALEHKSVKNIKRSLKRPHSRELLGISSVGKQGRINDEKRISKFNEPLQERLQTPDFWKRSYTKCLTQDYSDSIFEHLLTVEKKPVAVPRTTNITRACIINWLMNVNGPNGNSATLQSTCWYFDSILGLGQVQVDKLQLVAAACYWIAQKLHGPVSPAMKLVNISNRAFTSETLLAAEKTVLGKLKFPAQPVVPQEFITYLSWCCDRENPGEIEVAATFLCMTALMADKVITEEFPSVIAAAAVRNALLLLNKRELYCRLMSCAVYKAAIRKTPSMTAVSSILRRAIRTVSASIYEYKAPLEHYDLPPYFIAKKLIKAACELHG